VTSEALRRKLQSSPDTYYTVAVTKKKWCVSPPENSGWEYSESEPVDTSMIYGWSSIKVRGLAWQGEMSEENLLLRWSGWPV
jgi:hypothetical protein